MLGSDALMRLSLVISCPPGASGTLKSTRMKTRFPFRSRSRIERVMSLHDAIAGGAGWLFEILQIELILQSTGRAFVPLEVLQADEVHGNSVNLHLQAAA